MGATRPISMAGRVRRMTLRDSRSGPRHRFLEVAGVDVYPQKADPQVCTGDRRRTQTKKRIGYGRQPVEAVQPHAHLGELGGKSRGMGPIFVAALDGFVRDEPGVAPAAHPRCSRPPTPDVRLILVPNANCLTIEWRISVRREMEHELMAIVQKPPAVDRLVVADGEI